MRISRRKFTAAAVSLLALTPTGCSTLSNQSKESKSLLDRLPWSQQEEEVVPYPNPVKVASAWTADTLVQTNRTPTRGFGGRVFFYDEKSRPVPVEGTLIVHGFDDTASSPQEAVKRYEFTPEQLTRHFSQTDLGASYSVWIPWDAIGGEQKRISLVTSFKTSEGKMVQGIPATMVLPGASDQTEEEKIAAMYSREYIAHRDATHTGSTRNSGLTTTTIRRGSPQPQSEVTSPGITLPGQRGGTQIAATGQTPSVDLNMSGTPRRTPSMPRRSSILPASAQFPLQQ